MFEEDKIITPCVITAQVANTWQISFFDLKTSRKKQLTTIEHIIVPGQGNMENTTTQYFESPYHNQVTRQTTTNSKGEILETKYKYAADYLLSCDGVSDGHQQYLDDAAYYRSQYVSALFGCSDSWCRRLQLHYYQQNMHNARLNYINYRRTSFTDATNQFNTCLQNAKSAANADLKPILELRDKDINAPIEVTAWRNSKLTGAVFNSYNYNGTLPGFVYPSKTQKINLSAPSATFTVSTPNTTTLVKDSRYEDEETVTVQNGNPVEFTARGNQKGAYLWDYNSQYPVAKIENAIQADIAATSFEADGKGNWTFAGTPAMDATAPTGRKSYSLASGDISKVIDVSKTYIVSFWKTTTGTLTIMGATPYRTGKTIGNWTYAEYQVTGGTSVSISGTAGIDELRLYPKNARMNTYTYDVSLGITSESDVNGNILYYEYDAMGRLKQVKDMDKHIVKVMEYQYQKPVTQ